MPYFFSEENLIINTETEIVGEEAGHIGLAHRAKKGERVKLQGPDKKRFQAEILSVGRGVVRLKVLEQIPTPPEPQVEVVLHQSVVSEKALDFILQKSTELGVRQIVLFNSQNTAQKLSKEKFINRLERWGKVVKEAAKQSERSVWPEIRFNLNFQDTVEELKKEDFFYLADASGGAVNKEDSKIKKKNVVVGPEGGFTEEEVKAFKDLPNCRLLKLSNFILRAETASIAAVSIISNVN